MPFLDALPDDLSDRQTAISAALKLLLSQPLSSARSNQILALSEALRETSQAIVQKSRVARRKATLQAEAHRQLKQTIQDSTPADIRALQQRLDDAEENLCHPEPADPTPPASEPIALSVIQQSA
jgi:hypothetical protein